jgi:hypothetical protein
MSNLLTECLRIIERLIKGFPEQQASNRSVSLLQLGVKKAKKVSSLSPPSIAPRRIGAVAEEERS